MAATEIEPIPERYQSYVEKKEQLNAGVALEEGACDEGRIKLFSEIPCIVGEHVTLGRVLDSDADALADLIGNPNVQRYLPTYLFELQREDIHETIALLYGELFDNKESLFLAIRMNGSGELAGLAEYYGYSPELQKVSVGVRLREAFWNAGICTETLRLMVGYVYGRTDIEIVTASVMIENAGSARAGEKAGFIRTARAVEEDWGFDEPVLVDKFFC